MAQSTLDLDFPGEEGDIKIIREDNLNFAVQQLQLVQEKEKRKGGKYTGVSRLEWRTVAFYGERPGDLICACQYALAKGARGGETKELAETVERTGKRIRASLQEILKEMKKDDK